MEEAFRSVPGVVDVVSGYAGGTMENPTYEQVCTGRTGHAESVLVTFDPAQVSYAQLVDAFWQIHDPTAINRQGPDVGTQYRSIIFYHSPEQQKIAEDEKQKLEQSGQYNKPIATQIEPAGPFYRAEEYHQQYARKHPGHNTCPIPVIHRIRKQEA